MAAVAVALPIEIWLVEDNRADPLLAIETVQDRAACNGITLVAEGDNETCWSRYADPGLTSLPVAVVPRCSAEHDDDVQTSYRHQAYELDHQPVDEPLLASVDF